MSECQYVDCPTIVDSSISVASGWATVSARQLAALRRRWPGLDWHVDRHGDVTGEAGPRQPAIRILGARRGFLALWELPGTCLSLQEVGPTPVGSVERLRRSLARAERWWAVARGELTA